MTDRIERELLLPASPEDVWDAMTADGWLAEEVHLELRPGGDASFRSRNTLKTGWVEDVRAPARLTFWWSAEGESASRVELTLRADRDATLLRVIETRPLELLDLVGMPLPGAGGTRFGPALVVA